MSPDAFPPSLARVIYSFTSLNCYENICAYQFFRRYITKDVKFIENEAIKRGNAIHTAFEMRIGGGKPFPDGMQQYEPLALPFDNSGAVVEQKYGINEQGRPVDFWGPGVKIRGKIDLAIVRDDVAYINDWKSNKNPREDPFELEICAMLLHASNAGLKKIIGTYTWVVHNKVGYQYDLSDTNKTWNKCQQIIQEIQQNIETENFPKRPGPLCGYCSVLDCEHNRSQQ